MDDLRFEWDDNKNIIRASLLIAKIQYNLRTHKNSEIPGDARYF